MKRSEQELKDQVVARLQLETCKFAIHQGTSEMFGDIDDCTALVKPFCKLEGKPCAFYKQG